MRLQGTTYKTMFRTAHIQRTCLSRRGRVFAAFRLSITIGLAAVAAVGWAIAAPAAFTTAGAIGTRLVRAARIVALAGRRGSPVQAPKDTRWRVVEWRYSSDFVPYIFVQVTAFQHKGLDAVQDERKYKKGLKESAIPI